MEELSIAEKAMRYDVAVKKAKSKITGDKDHILYEDDVIEMFPELKESEDELTWLKRFIKEEIDCLSFDIRDNEDRVKLKNLQRSLAWLEKQGEQKPEVKYVYTKFRIGDVIVEIKPNGYCQPVTVKYVGEGAYSCESDDGKRSLSFPIISQDEYKLVEQKPAIKLERDDNGEPVLTPFEAELFSMMSEAWQGYSFGEEVNFAKIVKEHSIELLERAKEQKPAWSEEDERNLNDAILFIETGTYSLDKDNLINWLKSLRPQNHWKPSDAQIASLTIACDRNDRVGFDLTQLLKELKKL